jgi:cell division protein YceG involved in septum cleavage
VEADFLLVLLLYFQLPCVKVYRVFLQSPFDANAQRQRVLVLAGEGNEVLVSKHKEIIIFQTEAVERYAGTIQRNDSYMQPGKGLLLRISNC